MRKRQLTLAAALCLGLIFMAGTALADGGAVESVKIEADGITIEALADQNTDCTLIVALYDGDGRMVDVKTQTIRAGEDWNDTLPLIAQQAGADMVKVFLVDSETSEPVSQACAVMVDENGGEQI